MNNSFLGDSFLNSKWFDPSYLFSRVAEFFQWIYDIIFYSNIGPIYNTLLFFLAMFFLTIMSYCLIRLFEIRRKEHKHLQQEIAEYAHKQKEKEEKAKQNDEISKNPRWVKTLSYLFSQHESDWKLAVIEADSMLEDLLNELGFAGETLGDKLKSAAVPSLSGGEKFRALPSAWEVHTIRNRIAHEGTSFIFPQREAKRVIAIYESIFREYGYI